MLVYITQYPNNVNCKKCHDEYRISLTKSNTDDFVSKSNRLHNYKYSYTKTRYTKSCNKVIITCPTHGDFKQTPNHHLSGIGCPICNSSKGEIEISKLLTENNVKFKEQHRFDDCRNKQPLPFDFYLPELDTCIEYDGIQHYRPVDYFGGKGALEKRKMIDKIKTEYCKENNIRLIRIRYNQKPCEILQKHIT